MVGTYIRRERLDLVVFELSGKVRQSAKGATSKDLHLLQIQANAMDAAMGTSRNAQISKVILANRAPVKHHP